MRLQSFRQIHRAKLGPAMARWVKKNGRSGDTFKFIVLKGKNLFLLNYKV
jgi:hypothetical protein